MKTGHIVWLIAGALYVSWGAAVLAGKGGFIHLLLLCAIGTTFLQAMADWRAAQTPFEPPGAEGPEA